MATTDTSACCGPELPTSGEAQLVRLPDGAEGESPPRPRGGPRYLGVTLICCGVAMLPWLVVLAYALPTTPRVPHWTTAWVGLDTLEAVGLAATGVLLLRRDPRHCLAAVATAVLLVVDAWFDVTTSSAGAELVTAVVMALCAELPMAALCAVLAVRCLPRAARRG